MSPGLRRGLVATVPPPSSSGWWTPLLAEQTDECAFTRRYVSPESLKAQRKLEPSSEDPRPAIDPADEQAGASSATFDQR